MPSSKALRAPRLFASWNRTVSSSLRWMMSVNGTVITICFLTCCATDLEQKVTEAELAGLHQRAAAWLEQQEFFEEAARHAVAGRDWEQAAGLLEGIGAELYEQDRISPSATGCKAYRLKSSSGPPKLAFVAYALSRLGHMCGRHSRSKLQSKPGPLTATRPRLASSDSAGLPKSWNRYPPSKRPCTRARACTRRSTGRPRRWPISFLALLTTFVVSAKRPSKHLPMFE